MLVDTHCHLHFDAFDADRDTVIQRARDFGVKFLVNVGTDPANNEAAHALAKGHAFMFHTAGAHPHYAQAMTEEEFGKTEEFIETTEPAAIGEIGLDYFKSEADADTQKKLFARMLGVARKHRLPVIVHSRNAFRDTLDILKSETAGKVKGVMHCFSYGQAELKELLDFGFLASFTCNLTFKNAGALLEVAKAAPLDRIMLETDAPYLAPQVYRGKRNEPSCLAHLADFLAGERGVSREHLEEVTSRTAVEFFHLK